MRDREARTTVRVNVATDGTQANDRSSDPAMTAAGTSVAFFSAAGNLVVGDANVCPGFPNCPDIFVHDSADPASSPESITPSQLSIAVFPNPGGAVMELTLTGFDPSDVSLIVRDVSGRVVKTLANGRLGTSTITWNGDDDRGSRVNSGIYFCTLRSGGINVTQKLTWLADR